MLLRRLPVAALLVTALASGAAAQKASSVIAAASKAMGADNLNSITGQVKSGEGTVGKLIYSNETHDKLTAALESVESGVNELKTTLGRANRIGLEPGCVVWHGSHLNHARSVASNRMPQAASSINTAARCDCGRNA